MTDPDLALDRIRKATFALAAGGAIGAFAWRGWTWGAGFALGSAVSWLNYTILKQVAYAIGRPQTRKRLVVFMGLRYLIFGGGAYVILRFSKISMLAVLLGLFVSVAAVIVEIIIQLAYAPRT
jgi:hypothetical protein